MQQYHANSLLVAEGAGGYLLYVVGHFVRRDGAFPRYLHGTCVETRHFRTAPFGRNRSRFFKSRQQISFHRALLGRSVNNVGREGVINNGGETDERKRTERTRGREDAPIQDHSGSVLV